MALNSESPYVGDAAVKEMAGVESPNVLRAVTPPERPDPSDAAVVVIAPPALRDSAAAVVVPPDFKTVAEPEEES